MKWLCSVSVGFGALGSTAGAGPFWVHGGVSSRRDFGSEVSWGNLQEPVEQERIFGGSLGRRRQRCKAGTWLHAEPSHSLCCLQLGIPLWSQAVLAPFGSGTSSIGRSHPLVRSHQGITLVPG